jgi:hypothetical protein
MVDAIASGSEMSKIELSQWDCDIPEGEDISGSWKGPVE